MTAAPHPLDELRAARAELLAALQGCTAADLAAAGPDGEWSGRDVLLHVAAWLRELARLVPDLARLGYQRGDAFDPGPDWSAWNRDQLAPFRDVRPEAAIAGVATAHARLLDVLQTLDDDALRRRGPTRFGFEASGWELLLAEAAHEREHAAGLAARLQRPRSALDRPCRPRGTVQPGAQEALCYS